MNPLLTGLIIIVTIGKYGQSTEFKYKTGMDYRLTSGGKLRLAYFAETEPGIHVYQWQIPLLFSYPSVDYLSLDFYNFCITERRKMNSLS